MALVVQAIELKGTPHLRDACEAIEAWYLRLPVARLERRQQQQALTVNALRETNGGLTSEILPTFPGEAEWIDSILPKLEPPKKTYKQKRRTGLFNGWWVDQEGKRLKRVIRREYAEAYRLWAVHRDIREGKYS